MVSSSTSVLVVGAGPAGLSAALDLAQRGVRVTVIDRADAPSSASRAKGLQPRTLEIFQRLGVVDEVLALGTAFPRWRTYRNGTLAWEKSIYDLLGVQPEASSAVPFPQTWMLPQWHTERILREALLATGVTVVYGRKLRRLEHAATGVDAVVDDGSGIERVTADFVVGADGAASTVRKLIGAAFDGVTNDQERYLIADVRIAGLDRRYWHNWSDPTDPAARVSICPLPGSDSFQLVAPLLPDGPPPPLDLAHVQQLVDARTQGERIELTDAAWISLDRTNERVASRYRQGSVFLVGDAAHTVPAAGGQGMNTAIQDSDNLAWKLAAVLHGAPGSLLDTYEEERRPIAERLMSGLQTRDSDGRKPDIFQLGNHYRTRSLAVETRPNPGQVRAGDRAPDSPVATPGHPAPTTLFAMFQDRDITCLTFGTQATEHCREIIDGLDTRLRVQLFDVDNQSTRTAAVIRKNYDVAPGEQAMFLIRPDHHIGLATTKHFGQHLAPYLARVT